MEREVFMSGIGGQGIQVVTKMLAQAANLEGKYVLHFGYYMGSVRGGQSDCTVVIGTAPIEAPPIVPRVWGGIAMHPEFYASTVQKIRSGGVLLVNTTLIEQPLERDDLLLIEVPASKLALEIGSVISASMIAVGAFVAATGIVELADVERAMYDILPPYRHHHIPANQKALQLGADFVRTLPVAQQPGLRAWEPLAV